MKATDNYSHSNMTKCTDIKKPLSSPEQRLLSYLEEYDHEEAANAFKTDQTILDLKGNHIDNQEAKDLAKALKDNCTLTNLNLYNSNINFVSVKDLAEILGVNCALTNLNLGHNSLGADGVLYIAEALKANRALTNLNLSESYMNIDGARYLAEVLKDNCTLTNLNLMHNSIGIKGVRHIAEALKVNHAITDLNLEYNAIFNEGAKCIAEALKDNCTLTNLNLGGNVIFNEGARYLAEALKVNYTLINLNLALNHIEDKGVRYLAEALEINYTLINLNFERNNNADKTLSLKLDSTVQRNQGILKNTSTFVLRHFSGKGKYPLKIDGNYFKDTSDNINQDDEVLFYKNLKAFQKVSKPLLYQTYISNNAYDKNDPPKNKSAFDSLMFKVNNYINENYLQLRGICMSMSFIDESLPQEEMSKTYRPAISMLPNNILCDIFSKIDLNLWPNKQHLIDDVEALGDSIQG